jgi:thioredoxin-like negative regulator of GroEL
METSSRNPAWTVASTRPALVFLSQRSSGPSRRMESLVAWVKVTQKKRLRVIDVDADENPSIVEPLDVGQIPALVLVKDHRVLGRIEGRATGQQIDDLIRPHIAA